MTETVFKVGDRVYCIVRGWGIVSDISGIGVFGDGDDYPITVEFRNDSFEHGTYTLDGRYFLESNPTLSFTEYTLDGFSQERLIELPEKGEIIMVSNDLLYWSMVQFSQYNHNNPYPVAASGGLYRSFKRLR